jgi:hypothetical protein
MRTWIKLAPAVLLLLPFAPAASGADPEPTTAQTIEKLRTDVDSLRRDVKKLQDEMVNTNLKTNMIARNLDDIKELLQRLDRMASARESISRYGPPPSEGTTAMMVPTTATITVRNQYTANATIRINGRPYLVAPGRDLQLRDVPLGPVNYEVDVDGYGVVQPLRTETLRPNGRIITIFPQYGG